MTATILDEIARRDQARLRAYREHLDFYDGLQWPGASRRRERRLTFNYAKAFAEKVTSYLMSGLAIAVEASDASAEADKRARRAEEALRRVYEEGNLEELDFDTELDAAILGDACFKVTWDAAEGRVRVSAPDVQGLFAWWLGDDVTRVWRVASRYRLEADEAALLYGGLASRDPQVSPLVRGTPGGLPALKRKAVTITEVWTAESFQLWAESALLEETPNPYGVIPFVIYPNLREPKQFWGVSDLAPLLEPARELNRALSQLSTILELSGNPIAVLENVDDAQDLAVAPGAVWELPEKAKAYLLDLLQGGGVGLHVDYINLLYRILHDLSESPRTAFGENRQGLSGVALEMELHPLLQKVRRKRLIRGAAYKRRADLILRLLQRYTGEAYLPCRLQVQWAPALPQDRGSQVRDEQVMVQSGLRSRRGAMAALGVADPDAEFARWLEEQREEEGTRNGEEGTRNEE